MITVALICLGIPAALTALLLLLDRALGHVTATHTVGHLVEAADFTAWEAELERPYDWQVDGA